jgi:hypothetical protein
MDQVEFINGNLADMSNSRRTEQLAFAVFVVLSMLCQAAFSSGDLQWEICM